MKSYFLLQFKMLNRRLIDFGLPLIFAYTLIPLAFIFLSHTFFEITEFAIYAYVLIAISVVIKLNFPNQNEFLKSIFEKKSYYQLKVIQNVIYSLPFTLFLVYKHFYLVALVLNIIVAFLSLTRQNISLFNTSIPTPFSKKPFEFITGFRKTFYIFPLAYGLTYISVMVENFNLGVFSLLLVGVTCFSFYSKVENDYFVWIYDLTPKEFLKEKIKTCCINFSLLSFPINITLGVVFFEHISILLVFIMLCFAYLTAIICAKYSSFPEEMNISQGILIVSSLAFPPILLVFILYFYIQSIKKINVILDDNP